MALKQKNQAYNSDINVTPMVDVMLVLLIIFMVITPMLQKGGNVEMARTNNPIAMEDADKEDAVLIAIQRDGTVFFDTERVTPEQLVTKVSDRLQNKTDKRIFIRADAKAKYGTVVEVVDNVRSAGVDQVGLLTEQVPPQNQNKNVVPPPAAGGQP